MCPAAGINGYAFTNRKATLQAGEPHGSCVSVGPVATLWFKFTVTIDPNNPDNQPNYNFYLSGGPSFFTTVHQGSTLGSLTEPSCTNYDNFAPTGPLPGGTYSVQVGGLIGQTGYGALSFDLMP